MSIARVARLWRMDGHCTCATSPTVGVGRPGIRHGDNGDPRSMWSWKKIFSVTSSDGSPPGLGVDFVRATQPTTDAEYVMASGSGNTPNDGSGEERATLTLGQDLSKLGLGAVVWECGEDLAAFLGRHRHLVAGKKVLDLGTGTGIAGLAAAQCGARNTTLTDHPALGPLVRSNVERNAPGFAATGCVQPIFVPFSWDNHDPAEAMALAPPDDPFDLVLASDCLYDSTMFAAFRKALAGTCGPRTILLMAYKRRLDSREKDFFAQLEVDFDLEVIDPCRRDLPATSRDDLQTGSVMNGSTDVERNVYLLLGTLRGYRHAKDRPPPLDEWRLK